MYALHFVWNPSEGIDLGFFTIRYYSLMWAVAFAMGYLVLKSIYKKEGESQEKLDSLLFYTIVATMFGARVGHVLFYQPELFKEDFLSVFLPFRTKPELEFTGFMGLASHGAAIAIIIALYLYSRNVIKKSMLWVLDRAVLGITLGGIFIRFGNFMNSEILGHETTSRLGVKFLQDKYNKYEITMITGISDSKKAYDEVVANPEYSSLLADVTPKHPVQLYEALGYVVVFAILYYLYWKTQASKREGLLFGVFLVLLWSVRFVAEFLKESQGGFESVLGVFTTGQWLSLPFVLGGIYLILTSNKRIKEV
ncbi:MAG: prolipoprotein diacylglyceryl transferase [Bacteroidota bacterium]|nr:prolipoprotein diacylglyceryl transferase [Bacteroidota bacterium]